MDASYLRLHAETRGFQLGRPVRAKPTADGKFVLFLRAKARTPTMSLYEFDTATGKTRELLTPEQLLKGAEEHLSPEEKARRERQRVSVGGFTDFQVSPDGDQVLVTLVRQALSGGPSDGEGRRGCRPGDGVIVDPKFSPDGGWVAYVLKHDIYMVDSPRTSGEMPPDDGRHGEKDARPGRVRRPGRNGAVHRLLVGAGRPIHRL